MIQILQESYKVKEDLERIVENLIGSGGSVFELVALVSRDLSVLTVAGDFDTSLDMLPSAGAIALSVFSSILGETGLKVPSKIRIQLKDRRYLIIHPYSDRFLICITRPNPRLGFVELLLEYYKYDLSGVTIRDDV